MKSVEEIVILNIKQRMADLRWSQRQLAKNANIKAPSLNQMLKGKRPIGDKSRALIAGALGCDPEELRHEKVAILAPIAKQKQLLAIAFEAVNNSDFFSLWDAFQKLEPKHRKIVLERAQLYVKDSQGIAYGKTVKRRVRGR